jgi:hypothetical protein
MDILEEYRYFKAPGTTPRRGRTAANGRVPVFGKDGGSEWE